MRNWQLQEDTATEAAFLWQRLHRVAEAARTVANLAAAGECTGDYVSDLVGDLDALRFAVGRHHNNLAALRQDLDAESLGAPIA